MKYGLFVSSIEEERMRGDEYIGKFYENQTGWEIGRKIIDNGL